MSSFSDMDLTLINSHKKRSLERDAPIVLNPDDFTYPTNHVPNSKRIKLPSLMPYKLPSNLLAKLNLRQISLDDLDARTKLKLHHLTADSANRKPSSPILTGGSSVTPISRVNSPIPTKPSRLNIEQASQSDGPVRGTPKTPSGGLAIKEDTETTIKAITGYADKLKKASISLYQTKDYLKSILDFTQSYILFILALKLKEMENENYTSDPSETVKLICRKRRDWVNVLLFGEKIIDNFTKVLEETKGREREGTSKLNGFVHVLGFIHYTNGFIQLHLCNTILKHVDILRDIVTSGENKDGDKLAKLIAKYEETLANSTKALQVGEKHLGLFVIAKEYPQLWSQSFTKLSSVKRDTLVLPYGLNVSKKIPKFQTGVNYCLPICSHVWDLNNIINFSGFFLKEWCIRQSIKHSLIFE